jgi:hypothetical protein
MIDPDNEWATWQRWLGDEPRGSDDLRRRRDARLSENLAWLRGDPQQRTGAGAVERHVPLVGSLELCPSHGLGYPPTGRRSG